MTIVKEILAEVRKHKNCSRPSLLAYIKHVGIEPIGRRQRPQLYPDDTADRVIKWLGFKETDGKIVSLKKLQVARRKSRRPERRKAA
jgi:hypothetical protein